MGDTVKLRPNHYELLGLTPAATLDDVRRAFTKELNLLPTRPFGGFAQVSVAYETLRDPARRKAYDASLDLRPDPPAAPMMRPVTAHIRRPPALELAPKPVAGSLHPAPWVRPESSLPLERSPTPEPLRPARHEPRPPAPVEPEQRVPAPPQPVLRPVADRAVHHRLPQAVIVDEDSPLDWKVPAFAGGALIVALAFGAWLGLESGNDEEQAGPSPVATLKVPAPKAVPAITAPPADAPPALAQADTQPQIRRRNNGPIPRAREPLAIDLPETQPDEVADLGQAEPAPAAEPLDSAPSGPAATPASLPLPNAVVARTIGRIGYPCGKVSSVSAMDGPGAFKVTCTSGHSYRASPVRGRYRFKRL